MRRYLYTSGRSVTAALAFLAFLSYGQPTVADGPKPVVDVGVYYESLCGDSMRFIRDQLVQHYPVLKDYLNITFVPYGKASHWKDSAGLWQFSCQHGSSECQGNVAQACAIDAIKNEEESEKVQRLTVAVVGCAMSARYPPTAVPRCAEEAGLKETTRKRIDKCSASLATAAGDLIAQHGERTNNLSPPLSFVPTVTINGAYIKDTQPAVLNGFLNTVCNALPADSKPAACN